MATILLPLSLLLTLVATTEPAATKTGAVVLDIDHRKVQTGTDYYVLPVIRGMGGGLTLKLKNKTCPFNVGQDRFEVSRGLPLKFIPADPKQKFVQESTDMNAVFSAATVCVQSTAWRLGNVDDKTGRRYVMSGGVTGNPGVGTLSNWFKVERYREDYKLVFCPTVCKFCKVICGDLGVFVENGERWLGLSDVPLAVMFKKA
ncbi:hypothetical protein Scep_015920 [Stephania cephalantha]|uniref:Miraculin n=1 Tax=Stephania cephalantha TaxID=152367 RepID=A0AAP0INK0_9MAGN